MACSFMQLELRWRLPPLNTPTPAGRRQEPQHIHIPTHVAHMLRRTRQPLTSMQVALIMIHGNIVTDTRQINRN
eukprot:205314-Pleurochrysis_carterae.AAC.1